MHKVVQLIPYDGVGGVEAAARSMGKVITGDLEFSVRYLYPAVQGYAGRGVTFNPFRLLRVTASLVRSPPGVLIVSLWRSALVGILLKIMRPRVKLVVFIHNSVDAHALDYLITRCATYLACRVWSDSMASVERRFRRLPKASLTIISFLLRRLDSPAEIRVPYKPRARFIFWGRLAAQKNLTRAIGIFRAVRDQVSDATFVVIGPDGGEENKLRRFVEEIGLDGAVRFVGTCSFDEIGKLAGDASFYLQTSRYEGMALSVVEAMQLGLVPVVTPVGEVASYCKPGHNAVLVQSDGQVITEILELLIRPDWYRELRRNALSTWKDAPLYRDSVLAACAEILDVK